MKAAILLLALVTLGRAQTGLEVTLQKPFSGSTAGRTFLGTVSYYAPSWNRLQGFSEFGMVGMPELGYRASQPLDHRRIASLVGLYGGQLFLLRRGFLRVGFSLGSVWKETVAPEWMLLEGKEKIQIGTSRDTKFAPYYAGKLQVLLFSFIFSSQGVGLGLNFTL